MTFSPKALIGGAVLSGVALLSTGVLVYAFNPQPDPPGHYYGLMTLPATQTIELHVSNISRPITELVTGRTSPSVCNAELQIIGADGSLLASDSQRVMPWESFSLGFAIPNTPDLPPGPCRVDPSRAGGIGTCMQVRAQVVFTGNAAHCISSVEVGDPFAHGTGGGGGSGFIHPGLIVGFNPQPDPPGERIVLEQKR